MTNNKQLFINLQQGICDTPATPTRVLVETRVKEEAECCSNPTDAVLLDSMAIGTDECDDVFFHIVNGSGEAQTLVFGKRGQAGVYQKLGFPADASNVAAVTSDTGDGSAPNPNVLDVQGFNFLAQDGILVTGIEVTVNSAAGTAPKQVSLVRQSIDVADKCRKKRIAPACPECPNPGGSTPLVFDFAFCRLLDSYNSAELNLPIGADFDVRVRYAGLATAKGMVACSGPRAGRIMTNVTQTTV